jgi:hypothetical protein
MPSLSEEQLREKLNRLINQLQDVWLEDKDSWHGVTTTIPEIISLIHQYGVSERKEQIMQDELSLLDSDNFTKIDESVIIQWRIDRIAEITQSDSREGGEE